MTPPPNKCSFRSSAVRAWAQVPCMGSKVRLGNTPSGVIASEPCSVESCRTVLLNIFSTRPHTGPARRGAGAQAMHPQRARARNTAPQSSHVAGISRPGYHSGWDDIFAKNSEIGDIAVHRRDFIETIFREAPHGARL